ncbi:FMN-binding protein [Alloprevotella tannerae]
MKRSTLILTLALALVGSATSVGFLQAAPKVVANTQTVAPNGRQLTKLGLTGAQLEQKHDGIWAVSLKGKALGYVINSTPFAANVQGYRGPVPVLVYVDNSGKCKKVYALPNNETPSFFDKAVTVQNQFKGKAAKKAATMSVDAVSGATFSSKALAANVKAALDAYTKYVK